MEFKKLKDARTVVALVTLLALALRLYFAFKSPYFDYDAYFGIRQIGSIKSTGLPIFKDGLSYGGRTLIFSPLFYYILALINLIVPIDLFLKIVLNLLIVSVIPLTYLLSMEITKSEPAALFSALLSSLVPVLGTTINSINPFELLLPMVFYSLYCLIRINEKRYLYAFLISVFTAALISPLSLVLIPAFWVYLLFLKLEKVKERRTELEAITFSTFLTILIQILIYKKAILMHGALVFWQNIPSQLLAEYFSNITVLGAIGAVGIVPFVFGVYRIYKFSYSQKEHGESAIIAFVVLVALLLWLKLLQLNTGLIFLGVGLSIISATSFKSLYDYVDRTHASKYKTQLLVVLILLVLVVSVPQTISYLQKESANTPTQNQISALEWMRNNTDEGTTVLAPVEEGYLVEAVASRPSVMDENFLLESEIDKRYDDVKTIFTTKYETEAVNLLYNYDARIIFLSPFAQAKFNITDISYFDERCFKQLYGNETKVYETWCQLV